MISRAYDDNYPLRAALLPAENSSRCHYHADSMLAIVDSVAHPMTRVYPGSEEWVYWHHATTGFSVSFTALYTVRERVFLWWSGPLPRIAGAGPYHVDLISAPHVWVSPDQLMFYGDSNVSIRDQTTVLHNDMQTPAGINSATINATNSSFGGAQGAAAFTLVSPTAFPFVVAAGRSCDFVVRFAKSTEQREADFVIGTTEGAFTIRLSGKFFLW